MVICLTPANCVWTACDSVVGAETLACTLTVCHATGSKEPQLQNEAVQDIPVEQNCWAVLAWDAASSCFLYLGSWQCWSHVALHGHRVCLGPVIGKGPTQGLQDPAHL